MAGVGKAKIKLHKFDSENHVATSIKLAVYTYNAM